MSNSVNNPTSGQPAEQFNGSSIQDSASGRSLRWSQLDEEIDGHRKALSGSSKKVLRKAKSLFCCLHPTVQLDDAANDGQTCQQGNGGMTTTNNNSSPGSQKPVPRVHPSPESYDFIIGPKSKEDHLKKTLVLDLDETLVHSCFDPVPKYDFIIPVEIDGQKKDVFVQKRPFLDHFLSRVCPKFEVVVFTASLSKYADPVLDLLDSTRSMRWRLFREDCSTHKGVFVKDLNRLGRNLSQIIIIDNSPLSYVFQPGNAVPITGFFGDQTDRALLDVLPILDDLAEASDVREGIKRNLGESPAILASDDNLSGAIVDLE